MEENTSMQDLTFLKKGEKFLSTKKYFLIKSGRVVTREVLINNKYIGNELLLTANEIIGDFVDLAPYSFKHEFFNNLKVEIIALEDTILEPLILNELTFTKNKSLKKILEQLSKRNILKYYQNMYDSLGYILILLKFYADDKGNIHKKVIKWEKFNLGRSQFYSLYKKLKAENFIDEEKEYIKLKFHKVNRYLKALDKRIMEEEVF